MWVEGRKEQMGALRRLLSLFVLSVISVHGLGCELPVNPSPSANASEPWSAHANGWSRLGPPLRPCAEDLERFYHAWRDSLPGGLPSRPLEILSLGVTPEIALYPWAAEMRLTAIDASLEMIGQVWPGDTAERRAMHGDWLAMPFPDASYDLILNDAGLLLVAGAGKLRAAAAELRRVLRPEGRIVLRHFVRGRAPETPEGLAAEVAAGRLRNFHELKLRLLLALEARQPGGGVRLTEAYACFAALFPDRARLAGQLGCDPRTVETIEAYRGRDARYTFHSLEEMAAAFEGFALTEGPAGHYPAAVHCPVLILTPRS